MCKKFNFDHTDKWYIHNPANVLENDTHTLLWDFNIQADYLIPARRLDLIIIIKKRICKIVDFAVPTDHRINNVKRRISTSTLLENWKSCGTWKWRLYQLWFGAFGTITKGLLKGLEDLEVDGQVETIQMTALLRTARILRRILETWGVLLSLWLEWKTLR